MTTYFPRTGKFQRSGSSAAWAVRSALILLLAMPAAVRAGDIRWGASGGGTFGTNTNWIGNVTPGTNDFAHFQVVTTGTGPTYTVNFGADVTTMGAYVHRDTVTWNLNGHTYFQSGSTTNDPFVIGTASGEVGALTISNGKVTTSVSNGSLQANIGKATGATGTLTLQAGATWNSNRTTVGDNGVGTLTIGGTHTTGILSIAQGTGGTGTVNVNNAAALLYPGNTYVGGNQDNSGGTGTLNVSAGTFQSSMLKVWNTTTPSRINLSGGLISVGYLDLSDNPTNLNWTGGHLRVSSDIQIRNDGSTGVLGATVNLNSSQILTTLATLYLGDGGTLSQGGGQIYYRTFQQFGGQINGEFVNTGEYQYSSGTVNGHFVNRGTLFQYFDFTANDGIRNETIMNLGTGHTMTANGQGFDNAGDFELEGGTLIGGGPMSNSANFNGRGTIGGAGGFTNIGQFTQSGGALSYSSSTDFNNGAGGVLTLASAYPFQLTGTGWLKNEGTIEMNGGRITAIGGGNPQFVNQLGSLLKGPGTFLVPFPSNYGTVSIDSGVLRMPGTFHNYGIVTLNGSAASVINALGTTYNHQLIEGRGSYSTGTLNNSGTIEAVGGTLTLGGTINNTGGTLAAGDGAKLFLTSGLASNTGLISLTNGTLDANNLTLTNASAGRITGRGTVRTGGLTNNGQLQLSGGTSDIYGGVTSNSGAKVIVSGNATATFYDNVLNDTGSEFRVSTGATAVFFGSVSGGGDFTGGGTKIFEAGSAAALPPLATPGATIVQGAASLTTNYVQEESLTVNGSVNLRPDSSASTVNSLTVNGSGKLDVSNNSLIVDYSDAAPAAAPGDPAASAPASPAASIRSLIISGRAGGAWNGKGISSTAAASDSTKAIGYALASEVLGAGGGAFAGQSVDGSAVLIRFTFRGDANLDGTVGFPDLVALAQHYDTVGTGTWFTGDFDYDGNVNFSDLVALAQHYDSSLSASPIPGATPDFNADLAAAFASVPEPSSALMVIIAACGLVGKRSRRR